MQAMRKRIERRAAAVGLAALGVAAAVGFGASAARVAGAQAPAGAYAQADFRTLEGVLLDGLGRVNTLLDALADAVRRMPAPAAGWRPPEPTAVRLVARPAGGPPGQERYALRVEVAPPAAAAFVACAWEHDGGALLWHGPLSATVQLTPSGGDSVTARCYSPRGEELHDVWRGR